MYRSQNLSYGVLYYDFKIIQVKLRNDMPDDMLKDAIETSRRIISDVEDFETQGESRSHLLPLLCH